ncbi:MAG: 50S ribosomal protein L6 [Candidatus Lokiarchaeota archaeon]|nr:50S ribosomal protein L6 [Candidatus Lokiarchaeota archaeon]
MVKSFKSEIVVEIPEDITFLIEGKKITIEGKKGKIVKDFSHMKRVDIKYTDKKVILSSFFPRKSTEAKMGTLRSVITNAIEGVSKGYTYKMKIAYSHFPITVDTDGKKILVKNFIGERSPRITYKAGSHPIEVKSTKEDVVITGIDKEEVGQTAANIQKICRIRQKDKRIFQDGIYLYEKHLGDEIFWKLKV